MADRFGYGEIGLDINPCRGCEDYDAPDGCKSNGGCGKPITNYDRLISKSPEELAVFFDYEYGRCEWCKPERFNTKDCSDIDCTACIIDWLKQEAKDEQTTDLRV